MAHITAEEQALFNRVQKTGDWNAFTERYFKLPMSGTWFTPEDHVYQYEALFDVWKDLGRPDTEFQAVVDEKPTGFKVSWDPFYGGYPIFLLPHGFRCLPWMWDFLEPQTTKAVAVTGTGSGKAQPLNAKVLTPDGWVCMGDISVGDKVTGQDGLPKNVRGVYPQGVCDIYRITFSDGSSTMATADHLWLVDDGRNRPRSSWRIMKTSQLLTSRQRNFIPFMEPAEMYDRDLMIDPYLMGALLGDGTLCSETVSISSADQEILDRVEASIPLSLELNYISQYDYSIVREELKGSLRNPLITALREYGLFGHRAEGKFIPEDYLYSSYDDRVALLQGLLDTDAYAYTGIEYTTASKKLASDVEELVLSLGGKVSVGSRIPEYTYKGERKKGQRSYRLYIQFHNAPFEPFHLARKNDAWDGKPTRLTRRVVSVEPAGRAEAQCIDVDDNLYVTDDYIVTHNTAGVAIRALTYCALFPGYRFLNIAPTQLQADLALGEIEKWAGNTEFRKFIKEYPGSNPLWKEKPYPIINIEVVPGYPSTFICQTGRDVTRILGGERDWINADEAQLLFGIDDSQDVLTTRLRGTRSTGLPRSTKLTWITNPGHNPELMSLMDKYEDLRDKGDKSVLVLEGIDTEDNIYLTSRQIREQEKTMNRRSQDRWHGGQMSAVMINAEIGDQLLENNKDTDLDKWAQEHGRVEDGFGVMSYYREPRPNRIYVVAADAGKSSIVSMNSQNIPCLMVFDVTDFLEKPSELVAFDWFDGQGDYSVFTRKFMHAMVRYSAKGYYDAGNIQTAFEDVNEAFGAMPTQPIYFSGSGGTKKWAVAVAIQLMQDKQFAWPYIKGFWHQARIFEYSSRKKADDILATLFVFCLALRYEGSLWDRFMDRYKWDPDRLKAENIEPDQLYEEGVMRDGATYSEISRYSRIV